MESTNGKRIIDILWDDINACYGKKSSGSTKAPLPLMGVIGLFILCDRVAPLPKPKAQNSNPKAQNRNKMESFFKDFFTEEDTKKEEKEEKARALYQLRCALVHSYEFVGKSKDSHPTEYRFTLVESKTHEMTIKENQPQIKTVIIDINWLYDLIYKKIKGLSDEDKDTISISNSWNDSSDLILDICASTGCGDINEWPLKSIT